MEQIEQIFLDIKNLTTQGATNVALAVLDGLMLSVDSIVEPRDLEKIGVRLAYARPTEPLAQNAIRFIFDNNDQTIDDIKQKIIAYKLLITEAKKHILLAGIPLIKPYSTYLTHCHASTVTNVFIAAHNANINFSVIATETRPMMQGKITVGELLAAGLTNVTMIIDSATTSLLSDPGQKISAVFIGADLLTENGFVNKIGTLSIVNTAHDHNIPVYCFSTLLKYDPRPYSPDLIEKRSPDEVWVNAPKNLKIYSPAFDFIPFNSVVKIVTEIGIIDGPSAKNSAIKLYPFIK